MQRTSGKGCVLGMKKFLQGLVAGVIFCAIAFALSYPREQINSRKINLALPYAYEYNYNGATYADSGRNILNELPIEMKLGEDNRGLLRLGISNSNIKTLKNVLLHISFPPGIKVLGHEGWQVWDPNRIYFVLIPSINNGITASLLPITLEFAEPMKCEIFYSISSEDTKRIYRSFLMTAVK